MIVRPTWRNCLILTGVLFAPIVCGLGCDDEHSIRTYQSTKDATPAASAFGPGSQVAGQPAGQAAQGGPQSMDISWTLPPGWKMLPPPTDPQARSMEVARIGVDNAVPSAMLTIVPLGGEGGELLPNVVRWQRQLKLTPASTPQDVVKVAKLLTTPFGDVPVIDLSSPAGTASPQRIVAAAIPFTDFTCFITLRGPLDTISKERGHFDDFVRSLKFSPSNSDNDGPRHAAAQPPDSASPTTPAPAPDTNAAPTYQAPADWKPAPANNGMRVLGFSAGPALITVDRLPASGMNNPNALVNMWRSQVDLGALSDNQPVKPDAVVTIDGHIGMLFDLASPPEKNGKRVIVAMATVGNDDWFFKLIGPADAVAGQKAAFLKFVQSIHFAGGGSGGGQ